MQNPTPEAKRKRGIYLLPNLLTTGALFSGFYAIIIALGSHFRTAAVCIFLAMILDGLDGRVARMTHTQTPFGAQYDSLSDLIAFGIAPALIAYLWSLWHWGKLGWLIAFIYVAATALRLARFNTQADADKRYFQGLPCPSAAAVVASTIWICSKFHLQANFLVVFWNAAIVLLMALLMVSRVRYYSFKELDFRGRISFVTVLLVVVSFVAIAIDPAHMLFLGFSAYAVSGIVLTLWQLRKRRKLRRYIEERRRAAHENSAH